MFTKVVLFAVKTPFMSHNTLFYFDSCFVNKNSLFIVWAWNRVYFIPSAWIYIINCFLIYLLLSHYIFILTKQVGSQFSLSNTNSASVTKFQKYRLTKLYRQHNNQYNENLGRKLLIMVHILYNIIGFSYLEFKKFSKTTRWIPNFDSILGN